VRPKGALAPAPSAAARWARDATKEAPDLREVGHESEELHASAAGRAAQNVEGEAALEQLLPRAIARPAGDGRALGSASLAGVAAGLRTLRERSLLAGARTPAYRTVWSVGGGTEAASRQSSDSGSMAAQAQGVALDRALVLQVLSAEASGRRGSRPDSRGSSSSRATAPAPSRASSTRPRSCGSRHPTRPRAEVTPSSSLHPGSPVPNGSSAGRYALYFR
jgi:hypothetical protein